MSTGVLQADEGLEPKATNERKVVGDRCNCQKPTGYLKQKQNNTRLTTVNLEPREPEKGRLTQGKECLLGCYKLTRDEEKAASKYIEIHRI